MPRRPPRPYHHGDLPGAIREAALQLIAEHGPEGFTLREVARRIGVSHAAPYRHFADRRALVTALAAEGANLLAASIEAALAEAGDDLRARFLAAAHAYVRFAVEQPAFFRVTFLTTEIDKADPVFAAARERSFGLLLTFIAEAQGKGFFEQADPMALALPAWAMHHGLATLASVGALDKLGGDLRAISDAAHGRLLDGLARAESRPPPKTDSLPTRPETVQRSRRQPR